MAAVPSADDEHDLVRQARSSSRVVDVDDVVLFEVLDEPARLGQYRPTLFVSTYQGM